jgi:CrcB protein
MSIWVWIAVGLLGGAGSLLRVAGTLALGRGTPPLGTLAVNLIGAFALGALNGAGVTGNGLVLAGTALLGSFTTFSTWMHEVVSLDDAGQRKLAGGLLAGALMGGLAAAALGRAIAGWLG